MLGRQQSSKARNVLVSISRRAKECSAGAARRPRFVLALSFGFSLAFLAGAEQVFGHREFIAWGERVATALLVYWFGVELGRHLARKPASRRRDNVPASAKFLLMLIPTKYRDNIVGDLEEEFRTTLLPAYGPRWARLWYWWHTVLTICPFIVRFFRRAIGLALILKLIGR